MVIRIVVLVLVCCAALHQASAYYYSDEDNDSLEDLDSVEVRPGYGRAAYNSGRNSRQKPPVYGPTPYNSGHSGCWGKRLSQILAGHKIQDIGHKRVKKARNSLASHNTVKDQGIYNNCWAFSVMAVLERNIWKQFKVKIDLSEQYLIDCCRECQSIVLHVASYGGTPTKAFDFLHQNGLVSSLSYPYKGPVGECRQPDLKLPFRIEKAKEIQQRNEAALIDELDRNPGYFIAIVIMVDNALTISLMENPEGIVPQTLCGTKGATNHAVALVGYGTDAHGTGYWEIRNSQGIGHGNEGYFRMLRNGQNYCNDNAQVVYMVAVPLCLSNRDFTGDVIMRDFTDDVDMTSC